MKKILVLLIGLFLAFNVKASENDLVKVYIFEAGGCPACESLISYLKNLDSYNKEFEIVEKELYIDHINWELGKDYVLGVKVANAFIDNGFTNAGFESTPFVVISDVYAQTGANMSLEDTIHDVYQKGDNDVVSCIIDHKDDCLDGYVDKTYEDEAQAIYQSRVGAKATNTNPIKIKDNALVIFIVIIAFIFIALILINNSMSKKINESTEKDKKQEEEKSEPKVKNVKKPTNTTTKKTSTKKSTTTKKNPTSKKSK